jgi:hypothetical protein
LARTSIPGPYADSTGIQASVHSSKRDLSREIATRSSEISAESGLVVHQGRETCNGLALRCSFPDNITPLVRASQGLPAVP